MWRITYHVIPKPENPRFGECGGAYVNCWILYAWQDGAGALAKYELEKEWVITGPAEFSWYDSIDELVPGHRDREFFEQAIIDGGCFVYDWYPLDADHDEDFDLDHEMPGDAKALKTEH
jgi:hypothetical protein